MTKRKFYKYKIEVEVLSEAPLDHDMLCDLYAVSNFISTGDGSGKVSVVEDEELDGAQVAAALRAQGSDPEFFRVDDDGNDSIEALDAD